MNDKNPRVSVVIITHNQCEVFKRALYSVLNQDFYKDYEIIVINDSSQDNTGKYMEQTLKLHPNIRYRIVNNHSALLSRKDGIDLAKGDFICFLDGDDYFHPRFISKMYEAATKHNADIINCNLFYIRKGNKIKRSALGCDKTYSSSLKALKALFSDYYVRGFTPTKLYKTSILKEIDFNVFKDLPIYEDIVMNYFAFKKCQKLVNIKQTLYYYDKSHESSITTNCSQRIACNLKSAQIIKNDINSSGDKKLLKAFKHSYFRRKLLLMFDIKITKFANPKDKKKAKKKAYKDLKKIYLEK